MTQPSIAADLAWLFDVLWGDEVVRFTPPATPAQSYLAIPNARRARAFVPANRLGARAALEAGSMAKSAGARRARAAAGRIAGSPMAGAVFRDRFWVGADPLLDALASSIGEAPIALAATVRPPGPFRMPVLQVVTPDGRVVAYAKVAWNDLTGTNIRAEHAALELLAAADPPAPRAPAPLALLEHRGFPVLVTRPMPERLRRYEAAEVAPAAPVSRAVATLPLHRGRGSDPIGDRLRDRSAAVRGTLPHVHGATDALLDEIGGRSADLPSGAWHGDWSPWNLGWVGEQLWAWDWEYCRADVPLGLDLPHFTFQQRFIGDRRPVQDAFAAARSASAAPLSALGYDAAARSVLHAVHVAEVSLRYLEAETAGVTANPRFIAGAVPALRAAADALG